MTATTTLPQPPLPAAYDFVDGRSFKHRELVRYNWEKLGYEYRCTRDMVELWRHPITGHVAELTAY